MQGVFKSDLKSQGPDVGIKKSFMEEVAFGRWALKGEQGEDRIVGGRGSRCSIWGGGREAWEQRVTAESLGIGVSRAWVLSHSPVGRDCHTEQNCSGFQLHPIQTL